MKKLILMVGCPGSGKSTQARETKEMNERDGIKTEIISRDIIRFSIVKENEEYFSKETYVFNEFVRQTNEAIKENDVVIADATFLTPKSRKKFLDKVEKDGIILGAIVVLVSLEDCLKRNNLREGREKVPESALRRMYEQLDIDDIDKEFDEIDIIGV